MPQKIVTSVTTPVTSMDLTTLATWKDDWGVTTKKDDDFLRRSITRCSVAAQNFCNRRFGVESLTDTIYSDRDAYPYQTPGGVNPLQLSKWPVISVTSIVQQDASNNTTLVAGQDFTLLPDTGQLIRLDAFGEQMPWPAVVYVVTYQGGYVLPGAAAVQGAQELPVDIEDAVGRMVANRYFERNRDPMIAEETVVGVGSTKFLPGTGVDGNISPDIVDLLDNYRVPVAG